MEPAVLVEEYYESIDDGDYETLSSLLTPAFTQQRPDRRFDGRETFVRFMREERPRTDTEHEVHRIFETRKKSVQPAVAVEGTVCYPDGEVWFGFVDVFEVADDRLASLETYTR